METTELVDYGILQEVSDYRCHVCFGEGNVYIYRTEAGKKAIASGWYEERSATQEGIEGVTARGYPVPVDEIDGIRCVEIPVVCLRHLPITPKSPTTEKGKIAALTVTFMLRNGLLPLEIGAKDVGDQKMQVEGVDILVNSAFRIQVKCDWNGGRRGTGNLFLQTAECNPLRRF